jgi:NAD(P)-dependent dehydrogenase (short-subunit alcohol dehydrogenase family)
MSDATPPLQGRRILVTGGATGIGAAAVGVLTAAGAAVAATHHRTPPPDGLAATWLRCDVRDAVPATVRRATEQIPLGGTLGDPARDLGPVLVFLAGTGAGFITGQLLAVDGGLMMVGG